MAFEDYLDGNCDIFRAKEEALNAGYGIKQTITKTLQKLEPISTEVPCHFHFGRNNVNLQQQEPYTSLNGTQKVSFGPETDIRINDMIRDNSSGLFYRAGLPRYVHGRHHIVIEVKREDGVKGAL